MSTYATPLKLGPLVLRNRVIMASLTRDRNLIPGPLQVEYYTQRAGAGLILTEGTLIEAQGSEWSDARQYIVILIFNLFFYFFSWYLQ
jgi:2,4-dienoyl-CoA reductase-like NADH-dependent reductase (Old Yellow Enzyme family)